MLVICSSAVRNWVCFSTVVKASLIPLIVESKPLLLLAWDVAVATHLTGGGFKQQHSTSSHTSQTVPTSTHKPQFLQVGPFKALNLPQKQWSVSFLFLTFWNGIIKLTLVHYQFTRRCCNHSQGDFCNDHEQQRQQQEKWITVTISVLSESQCGIIFHTMYHTV